MRVIRYLAAAILSVGLMTVVAAQTRPEPGFGFSFFGTSHDVISRVLTHTVLQEELKVTDAQKEKLKPAIEKQVAMQKEFRAGGRFDTDKIAKLNEKSLKVAEELRKIIDDTLTAEQKKRLKQIELQALSLAVFLDPDSTGPLGHPFAIRHPTAAQKAVMKDVRDGLKLSESQQKSVQGIVDGFYKDQQEIMKTAGFPGKPGPVTFADAKKKVEEVSKEAWGKIESKLDDNQKKALKDLVGEPFAIVKLGLGQLPPKKD